jgi:glycosyltransferase involved in cell wall biosynthesis
LDATSIADGLTRLVQDQALRAHLSHRGLARSREFDWEKAVDDTWKVYQELIG